MGSWSSISIQVLLVAILDWHFEGDLVGLGVMATSKYNSKTTLYRSLLLVFLLLILIATLGNYWYYTNIGDAKDSILSWQSHVDRSSLVVGGLIYSILLSLPFVPGVELGLLLMCVFGRTGILMVYLCTVFGLSLAFFIGRCFGYRSIEHWLKKMSRMKRSVMMLLGSAVY